MSREDVRLEGYEPGNGYQPSDFGLSLRDFLRVLPFAAATVILFQVRNYLGSRAAFAFIIAQFGAGLLAVGAHNILRPERLKKGATEKGARRVRIGGIVEVAIGTAVMTLAIGDILVLAEGW